MKRWLIGLVCQDLEVARLNSFVKKQQKLTRETFIRDMDQKVLRVLMESEAGRWFIMRLFDKTYVHQTTFTGNYNSFYNEGRRSIGVELMQQIGALGKEGVKLKHTAELEYVERQEQFEALETANQWNQKAWKPKLTR